MWTKVFDRLIEKYGFQVLFFPAGVVLLIFAQGILDQIGPIKFRPFQNDLITITASIVGGAFIIIGLIPLIQVHIFSNNRIQKPETISNVDHQQDNSKPPLECLYLKLSRLKENSDCPLNFVQNKGV